MRTSQYVDLAETATKQTKVCPIAAIPRQVLHLDLHEFVMLWLGLLLLKFLFVQLFFSCNSSSIGHNVGLSVSPQQVLWKCYAVVSV